MFDRTKHLLYQTINDVKSIAKFFTIFIQAVYMAYLIYAIIVNSGMRMVNGILLALSLVYFIFYLTVSKNIDGSDKEEKKEARSKLKKARRFYQRSKILINVFPLGVSIYSICLTSNNLTPFTLLSTVFMVFSWVLQILIQIIVAVVENRWHLFEEAINADINEIKEPFTKPIRETGNFIKKVFGKEPDPAPQPTSEPSKGLQKIEKQLAEQKQAKKDAKEQAKLEKSQARQQAKEARKRMQASVKKENELLNSASLTKAERNTNDNE